jgi:hypothetical protein
MPTVPYKPYSDVTPSGAEVNIPTPPEAFGVGVARAKQALGSEVEQASDKLFNRALAFQQLNNETSAEQGNLKLMDQAGDIHAKYDALQGEERVNAYPAYKKNLLDLQAKIRADLTTDMARRMYDNKSLNTVGHAIFNGAGAAATAQKEWQNNTNQSVMDMSVKTSSDDPTNEILLAQNKKAIELAATKIARDKYGAGPDSPITENLIANNTSKLVRERISSIGLNDPWTAGVMLDTAKKNHDLTGPDADYLDKAVRTSMRAIGSANIANEVYQAGLETKDTPAKPLKVMEDEAREKYKKIDPNDPIGPEDAAKAVRGIYNQDKYAKAQETLTNTQAIDKAIRENNPRTVQELRALSPKIAKTIDALPDSEQNKLPNKINGWNSSSQKITNQDNYQRLYGLSNSNVESFLNTDMNDPKEGLNQADIRKLQARQEHLKLRPIADPRVQKYMTLLRGARGSDLEALGVYSRTQANKDEYDRFQGGVQVALDDFFEANKRPPTNNEFLDKILPDIIQPRAFPGRIFGTNEYPLYDAPTYTKEYTNFDKQIRADMADKGRSMTDEEVRRAYTRAIYDRFHSKAINAK